MPSTYSDLKIELMATGENETTWGDITNTNLGTALEEAIVGSTDVTFASANVTLTLTDTNSTQPARHLRLRCTGVTGGASRNLVVPSIQKVYIIRNDCADSIVVKTAAGSGVTVPTGRTLWVYSDATNVVDVVTHLTSVTLGSALAVTSGGTGVTTSTGSGSVVLSTSPTLVTPNLGTPSALTLTNATGLPIDAGTTGTLPVARGGTGGTTSTGSGAVVLATSPTLVTPNLGTPSAVTLTNATGLPIDAGTTGTLPVARGGTGGTTSTGSGAVVLATSPTLSSPTLTTPNLGTPSAVTLTNATGLPIDAGTTGTLPVSRGGSGAGTLTGVLIGNGTSAFTTKTNPSGAFVGDTDTQNLTNKTLTTGNTLNAGTTVSDTGTIAATSPGFRGLPPNSQGGAYALVLTDAGKMVNITTGGVNIPANASVAFPEGTTVVIYNNSGSTQNITITSDTLRLAGTSSTGTRTISQRGLATCVKVAATEWVVSGNVS